MKRRFGRRLLIYSHDSYGLGHLRRCLRIAEALGRVAPEVSTLITTGSPSTQSFKLPRNCDTVKLPAVTKDASGSYRTRSLATDLSQTIRIRAELLRSVARSFEPDVVLVDHTPAGPRGELMPLIDEVSRARPRPRLVLGLRDIIDEPSRVRAEWTRMGAWRLIEDAYDRVFVYGDPGLPTTAQDLDLQTAVPGKLRMLGYLAPSLGRSERRSRGTPLILVTPGGGGDGHKVLRAYCRYLKGLPAPAPFHSLIVTGPLMSARRRGEIAELCGSLEHSIEVISFTNDMDRVICSAHGIVSMAGYNTVVEILAARVPALLVPRDFPRREQTIRAERLARISDIATSSAAGCTSKRIAAFVTDALHGPALRRPPLDLDGLSRTAHELRAVLRSGSAGTDARRDELVSIA